MKKIVFSLLILATVLLTGCSGISSMKSNHKKVGYQATPDPVATMDDKVVVKYTCVFPEKYFDKNAVMFVQPVFSWDSGDIRLDPINLRGENVEGEAQKINYEKGGRYTYTDMLDYKEGMETGKVTLTPVVYKASNVDEEALFAEDLKSGTNLSTVLISDGVNNTSSWIDIRGNISISPINYNKTQGIVETADIYFPNGTSILDWGFEMNRKFDAKANLDDLKRIMLENGLPKQITITGWASPEGEETHNAGVSKNRADIATELLNNILDEVLSTMARRAKVKQQDIEYYKYNLKKQMVITTRSAGEDWVHFVVMVEASDIQDKHAIINVAETQQNLIKRERVAGIKRLRYAGKMEMKSITP